MDVTRIWMWWARPIAASARSLLNVGDKNELIKSSHEGVSLPEREDGSESSLHF